MSIKDIALNLKVLSAQGIKNFNDFIKSTENAEKSTKHLGNTAKDTSKNFLDLGGSFIKTVASATLISNAVTGITNALISMGKESVTAAASFDASMRNVNSILQLNEEGFKKLSASVQGIANKQLLEYPKDMADSLYQIVSASFEGKDALDIMAVTAKGASAGLADMKTTADLLTTALNANKLSGKDADDVMNQLITTVFRGKTTLPELANNLGQVFSTSASVLGQTKESIAAVNATIATLTRNGLSTAEAVTATNNALISLVDPAEESVKAAKALGIEFNSAAVRTKNWIPFLNELMDKVKGFENADVIIAKLFPNIRSLKAMNILLNNYKELGTDFDKIIVNSGNLDKALDQNTNTLQSAFKSLKIATQVLGTEFYNTFGGTLIDVLNFASKSVSNFSANLKYIPNTLQEIREKADLTAATIESIFLARDVTGAYKKEKEGLDIQRAQYFAVKKLQEAQKVLNDLKSGKAVEKEDLYKTVLTIKEMGSKSEQAKENIKLLTSEIQKLNKTPLTTSTATTTSNNKPVFKIPDGEDDKRADKIKAENERLRKDIYSLNTDIKASTNDRFKNEEIQLRRAAENEIKETKASIGNNDLKAQKITAINTKLNIDLKALEKEKAEFIKDQNEKLWDSIQKIGDKIYDDTVKKTNNIIELAKKQTDEEQKKLDVLFDDALKEAAIREKAKESYTSLIQKAFDLAGANGQLASSLYKDWGKVSETVTAFSKKGVDGLKSFIESGGDITTLANLIEQVFIETAETVTTAFTELGKTIRGEIQTSEDAITQFDNLMTSLPFIGGQITGITKGIRSLFGIDDPATIKTQNESNIRREQDNVKRLLDIRNSYVSERKKLADELKDYEIDTAIKEDSQKKIILEKEVERTKAIISNLQKDLERIRKTYEKKREELPLQTSNAFQADVNKIKADPAALTKLVRESVTGFELGQQSQKANINNLLLRGIIDKDEAIKRLKALSVEANIFYQNIADHQIAGSRTQLEYQEKANAEYENYAKLVEDTLNLQEQKELNLTQQKINNQDQILSKQEKAVDTLENKINNSIETLTQKWKDQAEAWRKAMGEAIVGEDGWYSMAVSKVSLLSQSINQISNKPEVKQQKLNEIQDNTKFLSSQGINTSLGGFGGTASIGLNAGGYNEPVSKTQISGKQVNTAKQPDIWGDTLSNIGTFLLNPLAPAIKGIGSLFGFADGGIITKPTLGVIGEGREPEGVFPLSKLDEFLNRDMNKNINFAPVFNIASVNANNPSDIDNMVNLISQRIASNVLGA